MMDKVLFLIGVLMIVVPLVLMVLFVPIKALAIGFLYGAFWLSYMLWVALAICLMQGMSNA